MRCRDTFPLSIVIGCGAATRASRFGPARSLPRVEMSPQQQLERRWERFQAPSRVPDLWLVLNDDFRPAASHIRSSPGEADRLAARIGPQAQRKQIGKTEGSLDVQPVIRFKSDADRECCGGKAL
jgi:hypothetical protein